jgi:hypothetical protein
MSKVAIHCYRELLKSPFCFTVTHHATLMEGIYRFKRTRDRFTRDQHSSSLSTSLVTSKLLEKNRILGAFTDIDFSKVAHIDLAYLSPMLIRFFI